MNKEEYNKIIRTNLIDSFWALNKNWRDSALQFERPFIRANDGQYFSQLSKREFDEFNFSGKLPIDIKNFKTEGGTNEN